MIYSYLEVKTEKQFNVDSQDTQQIGQDSASQHIQKTEKTKINYWMISKLMFAILFLMTVCIFVVSYRGIKNSQSYLPDTTPKISPTSIATNQQTTNIPTASSASSLKLEDFTNKELLGENDNYSVYLINPKSGNIPETTGEIIIYDKERKVVTQIDGSFSIFGATIVFDDGKGEYVLLSTGTYTSRGATVISMVNKKQAVDDFCISGKHIFWENFIVYSNCDTFENRPWGVGEASSVAIVNLVNGQTKILFRSDLTRHYEVNKIENNTLYYEEVFVDKETDWNSQELQKTVTKTYNLLSL